MLITEDFLIKTLVNSNKVLLLNPQKVANYPPLGLMKISSFLKARGVEVKFSDFYFAGNYDLICITTLFTYDSKGVFDAIESSKRFSKAPIIIGGILNSILPNEFEKRYPNVYNFVGFSKILDSVIPDYSIDWHNDPIWNDYCFLFTQRGCINNCAYCSVKKIEPEKWENPFWKSGLIESKNNVAISDNHLLSCSDKHFNDVVETIVTSGKKVLFNNGLDCKYVTDENAEQLARMRYVRKGLRLAFDRISEDGMFQNSIETLVKHGCKRNDIEIYVLFGFDDKPWEADYRCSECLCLKIQQYPIPYRPLNRLSKTPEYIGKHWTLNLLRCFREFWLFGSFYRKMKFEEFLLGDYSKNKFRINDNDIETFRKK